MSNYSTADASPITPINFLYALEKGGIERQEAHEQTKLVNSADLPKECCNWEKLESWGVVRGESVDDLFLSATLPEGWKKVATDHSMWSNLVDQDGLIRASIFYKGAFYDRAAHISPIENRYHVSQNYDIDDAEAYEVQDSATGTTVKQFPATHWGYIVEVTAFLGQRHEKKIIGVIHDGQFHYETVGKYSAARFTKTMGLDNVTQITYDQFCKDFHHVEQDHEALGAARFLSRQKALALSTKLNQESNW
jgi:hypothetical protein